jgi:ATP-binding cassette subfamily G (WHITE) protein 2 (SNQ2)
VLTLASVTDSNGRTRRKNVQGPLPGTALEFAKAFRESELGRANQEDIASYTAQFTDKNTQRASAFVESTRTERAKHTRAASPYTISIPMQARAVMVRRLQIIKGSIAELLIQVTSFILQGIIVGTVFLKLPESTSAFFSRGGVLFLSVSTFHVVCPAR